MRCKLINIGFHIQAHVVGVCGQVLFGLLHWWTEDKLLLSLLLLLQAGCVIYIDTEKKFSSRRVVEMAKAHWPEVFTSQVRCICSCLPCYLQANTCSEGVLSLCAFLKHHTAGKGLYFSASLLKPFVIIIITNNITSLLVLHRRKPSQSRHALTNAACNAGSYLKPWLLHSVSSM